MSIEELQALGFNRNEAIVYHTLAILGKADAAAIIRKTKFHKNIVYDNLAKLIDKGLATYVGEAGRRIYQIASGTMLVQYFADLQQGLERKKAAAVRIAKEIDQYRSQLPDIQDARIYRNISGVRSFYEEVLRGGEYLVFGAPQDSIHTMGEHFWFNHDNRRRDLKLNVRMIFNASIRYHGEKLVNEVTEIRYFPRDFEPLTETHIQDDIVAVIVWSEEPVVFVMQDRHVADSYRVYFEKMWIEAEK